MSSYNKWVGVGNLVKDPEVKNIGDGIVAKFTVATSERFTKKNGEAVEEAVFMECTAFGSAAKFASQYPRKGDCVLVEGRLRTEKWQAKDGSGERSRLVTIISEIKLLKTVKEREADKADRAANGGARPPDRKSTRLNSSHIPLSRMPSSA